MKIHFSILPLLFLLIFAAVGCNHTSSAKQRNTLSVSLLNAGIARVTKSNHGVYSAVYQLSRPLEEAVRAQVIFENPLLPDRPVFQIYPIEPKQTRLKVRSPAVEGLRYGTPYTLTIQIFKLKGKEPIILASSSETLRFQPPIYQENRWETTYR